MDSCFNARYAGHRSFLTKGKIATILSDEIGYLTNVRNRRTALQSESINIGKSNCHHVPRLHYPRNQLSIIRLHEFTPANRDIKSVCLDEKSI